MRFVLEIYDDLCFEIEKIVTYLGKDLKFKRKESVLVDSLARLSYRLGPHACTLMSYAWELDYFFSEHFHANLKEPLF